MPPPSLGSRLRQIRAIMPSRPVLLRHRGQTLRISRSESHPENYLWLEVGEATYFLGVAVPGMTRGAVKRLALEWLRDREAKAAKPSRGRSSHGRTR